MTETNAQMFDFELVSPERRLLSTRARMVVVPGEEGEFGVLQGHSSLVATVRPGVVAVYTQNQDDEEPQRIFIAGGFADVTADNCTILAEEAVNVNDLSKADLEQTIRNLNEDLGMVSEELDRVRVTKKLALAKAKLEAVTGEIVL